MQKIIIVLGSVNIAAKLFKHVQRSGCLKCELIKTPAVISGGGCSYSIKAEEKFLKMIENEALKRKIKIKDIYREISEEGVYKYESIS